MLEFRNVSFTYKNSEEKVLNNVSFKINEGECVLLTGISGSGKSTIVHLMNGLIPALYEGELTGKIYYNNTSLESIKTYDIAKQSKLSQHNLDNKLASNLYELLENKNSAVMLNWNMNIVNSYTISVLERIKNLESFIVSPEINFAKIRELGKTRLKKALLVYSKLKGMTIDVDIAENKDEVITNKENDRFNIIRNEYGTEIFLDKPLNIINIEEDIKKLNVDIIVLEFTTETIDEIRKVLKQ